MFDELRQQPIAQSNLETVYVVDPSGDVVVIEDTDVANFGRHKLETAPTYAPDYSTGNPDDFPNAGRSNAMSDGHVIFQRKIDNVYRGSLPHVRR